MSDKPITQLRTTGVIADLLDVPLYRVLYILKTRPHIQPSATAGIFRLYDKEAVALILDELQVIDASKNCGN